MRPTLSLNFLWHMHQPYYRDDLSSEIVMPWVFLHAIKDYYEMPWLLSKFPTLKATFNLVPSLLVQLEAYEEESVNDIFLKTYRKPIFALDFEEKVYLMEYCFFSNETRMIKPLSRYAELLQKRKRYVSDAAAAEAFDDEAFLDLEVLFMLSWCGNYLRQTNTTVKQLLAKGKGYTHVDKEALLSALHAFIKEIIPFYKLLQEKGQIEISTTPFNHPISPLLFDIENGKRANAYTTLPKYEGDFKPHALKQIENAITKYETLFGTKPTGFWPAEGAVSYAFLEEIASRGIQWACSDEEVLYKSGHFGKEDIYKNNVLHFKEGEINLFFRHRELSDLIGFSYSGWDAEKAVDDLMGRLADIYNSDSTPRNVNIILDGENAWEHYPDNAMEFFNTLYERLSSCEWIETRTFEETLKDSQIAVNDLHELSPGSWINANFNIWIGHEEKNAAWELLFETKADVLKYSKNCDQPTLEKIENEFLIAQSSDWFWWYGDDHHTDLATTFDKLFRTHLINIYTLMDRKVPDKLYKPIVEVEKEGTGFITMPIENVTATLDGKISHFYEWLGCGEASLKHELSAMNMHDFAVDKVYFGCDEHYCYVALIGDFSAMLDYAILEMEIGKKVYEMRLSNTLQQISDDIAYITDEIIEIKIAKSLVTSGARFKLFMDGKLLQLLPLYSEIPLTNIDTSKQSWYI